MLVGAGTYVAAPSIVHLAHERPGPAALSLGVRVAAPVAGYYAGDALGDHGVIGILGGVGVAWATDWLLLARDPGERQGTSISLVPTDGGGVVGVTGRW